MDNAGSLYFELAIFFDVRLTGKLSGRRVVVA
jgi:hypothetical protein